ncbi:helix-turn-helix domain-containing protein [Actinoallomurus acaciae]|uniref:Helix-turn-helix domain-containing protein n=1 Tax=Actinoallomurus acaciae TaxID=502577 RepID=A0ABV5Y709_9ACTN
MTDHASAPGGNTELRDFLRSRRARITPLEVGLGSRPTDSRRVPGLRREEVAQLAGVSVDYYVRLERGRNLNVSESVLNAVARALCLDETERAYLLALAKPTRTRPRAAPVQSVRPGLRQVLDASTEVPAMVLGHRLDILAINRLARALLTGLEALPRHEWNMARLLFGEEGRRLYTDWALVARGAVAALRLYAGRHADDPRLAELVDELSTHDEDFRAWWGDHDVHHHAHGTERFHHPVVGDLSLQYEALTPNGDPDQVLCLHVAEPGSPSEQALRLLARRSGDSPARAG